MPTISDPMVAFDTRLGRFVVRLFQEQSPISTDNLLQRIETGLFAGSTIYRIVNMKNQEDTVPAKIEVIQFGYPSDKPRADEDLGPWWHPGRSASGHHELREVEPAIARGTGRHRGFVPGWYSSRRGASS